MNSIVVNDGMLGRCSRGCCIASLLAIPEGPIIVDISDESVTKLLGDLPAMTSNRYTSLLDGLIIKGTVPSLGKVGFVRIVIAAVFD